VSVPPLIPTASSAAGPSDQPAEAFTAIAPFYDELMKDVPYSLWEQYVLALAHRHGAAPVRILDLACGTGSLTLLLADDGYTAEGIDGSEEMLAVAREKASKRNAQTPFFLGDLRSFTVDAPFDLVLCLYDSLNNLIEPGDLEQAFKQVRGALVPDGLFIFDLNTDYALRANLFTQQNMRSDATVQYRWVSRYNYETRLCTVEMEFWVREGKIRRYFKEIHRQLAHSPGDLERMLESTGLELLATYDGLSFRPPESRTDRMYCVARALPGKTG
jgi:SAM-dependent methyltransferase